MRACGWVVVCLCSHDTYEHVGCECVTPLEIIRRRRRQYRRRRVSKCMLRQMRRCHERSATSIIVHHFRTCGLCGWVWYVWVGIFLAQINVSRLFIESTT